MWVNLGNITLSERSQSQRIPDCMIPFKKKFRIDKSVKTESRLVVGWVGVGALGGNGEYG